MSEQVNPTPSPLDVALQRYREAQASLEGAQALRDLALEAAFQAAKNAGVEMKEEGTTSINTDYFKVSFGTRMNRTVDQKAVAEIKSAMRPGAFNGIFITKYALSKRGMEAVQTAEPDQFTIAAKAITTKPGKPTLKVEVL